MRTHNTRTWEDILFGTLPRALTTQLCVFVLLAVALYIHHGGYVPSRSDLNAALHTAVLPKVTNPIFEPPAGVSVDPTVEQLRRDDGRMVATILNPDTAEHVIRLYSYRKEGDDHYFSAAAWMTFQPGEARTLDVPYLHEGLYQVWNGEDPFDRYRDPDTELIYESS